MLLKESVSQNVPSEIGTNVSFWVSLWFFRSFWLIALQRGAEEGSRLFTATAVKSSLGFFLQMQTPSLKIVHSKHLPSGSVTHLSAEV